MAIPNKQIGWSNESNLIWEISRQLEQLIGVASTTGNVSLLSYQTAFVEVNGNDTTAVLGNPTKPYATIQAALDNNSSVSFLKISLGIGEFNSPPQASLRSNLILQGSGKPHYNTDVTVNGFNDYTLSVPTKLIGGTILHNTLIFTEVNNLQIYDLGVDVGTDWVNNYNSGNAAEGILIAQNFSTPECDPYHPSQTTIPPKTGVILKNISVLGTYGTVHGILLESQFAATLDNITSCCAFYNLILKTSLTNASNITLIGSSQVGLYLKSNCYAYFLGANITNLNITSFNNTETGGGIYIGGDDGINYLQGVNLRGFNISRTAFGIKFYNGAGFTTVIDSLISDGIIRNCRGTGVRVDSNTPVVNCSFRNLIITNNLNDGFSLTEGSYNSISGIRSYDNSGVGFALSSTTRLDVCDIFSNNNSGGSINYGSNVYIMGVTSISGAITGSATSR